MSYPQFKKDLQHIHESEVFGLASFETAARFSRNAERKEKWLVLAALEEQTLQRYLDYMRETNQTVVEPAGWSLIGYGAGVALGLLPWRLSMKALVDATAKFQVIFRRLMENSEEAHRDFFAYVFAHEKAIEAFAKKELARDRNSLKAVNHLLAA